MTEEELELVKVFNKIGTVKLEALEIKPIGKTARFITLGKHKPRITREHIHSSITITIEFCPDCGKVLGGEKKK